MSKIKTCLESSGWEIETDSGFAPLTHVMQTEEYTVWKIRTENDVLCCADTHILFDASDAEVFAKDLLPGDRVLTRNGVEVVVSVEETETTAPMYDVSVATPEHRYYSGAFLSHNSTITVSFLLWYILFHENKNCAILANKGATARQILARLQLAYYNLPKWLQQGIVDGGWNKGSIALENGSRIMATSTSSDSVRGESFSCVSGDTKVTILDAKENVFHLPVSEIQRPEKNDGKKVYAYMYKTTNIQTNKEYINFHSSTDPDDGFLGRGREFIKDVETYGVENFKRRRFQISCTEERRYLKPETVSPSMVLTSDGFRKFFGLKVTYGKKSLYEIRTEKHVIRCTPDHLLMKDDGTFVAAEEISVGTLLLQNKRVLEKKLLPNTEAVYDLLNVAGGSHYTTNGLESHNCVFVDECAFVPGNIWNEFWRSTYPTISSGQETKCIIVSTPKGQNHFYDIWQEAEEGKSSFVPLRVDWWDVPGRDAAWEKVTRSNMSEEDFAVEYGNSFLGSSYTLLRGDYITRMGRSVIEPLEASSTLRVYKTPEAGHRYFLSVDCADLGVDASVISVIDISQFPYEQVAVFRDSKISHLALPTIIQRIGERYNTAPVLVESNDVGKAVLTTLNHTLEYPEVISTKSGTRYELGLRTTKKTKALGCKALKDFIESGNLLIKDKWTYEEFKRFVISGVSYAAEEGFHDDIVMSLVLFAYFATTGTFKMHYDQSFSDAYRESLRKELEETVLLPLPMFSDERTCENKGIHFSSMTTFF